MSSSLRRLSFLYSGVIFVLKELYVIALIILLCNTFNWFKVCGECMITLSLPRSGTYNFAILKCAPVFAVRLLRCACGLGMQYCQVFF